MTLISDRGYTVLFRTVHGSRLYGLDTPTSDWDWYTVVAKPEALDPHTSKRGVSTKDLRATDDETIKDVGTFLRECMNGSPQALEAMFSQEPTIDLIPELRSRFYASAHNSRYYRGIIYDLAATDTIKHRRHALRLALNVRDLRQYRRFNPRMLRNQIDWATDLATRLSGEEILKVADYTAWGAPLPKDRT